MPWLPPRIGLHVAPGVVTAFDLRAGQVLGKHPSVAEAFAPLTGTRARVSVVLSDAHCRCLVTTRPPGVRNRRELSAAAESRVRTLFGETGRWRVRLGALPAAGPDFVAAADGAVLDALEDQASEAGLRIVAVRPHWVAWAHHFRVQVRRDAHWVVSLDEGWATLGHIRAGQCVHARTVRRSPDLALDDLVARESALADAGAVSTPVWLGAAPADAPLAPAVPATALWNVKGASA